MLKLNLTLQFKRDLKLCQKRNYNISLLNAIVNTLRIPTALSLKNKDHALKGNYAGRCQRKRQADGMGYLYTVPYIPDKRR